MVEKRIVDPHKALCHVIGLAHAMQGLSRGVPKFFARCAGPGRTLSAYQYLTTHDVRHILTRGFGIWIFVWVVVLRQTAVGGPNHIVARVGANLKRLVKGFHGAPN